MRPSWGPHVEFVAVELGELDEDSGRLVSVMGHGGRQSLSAGRTDGLLVVGDVSDQQGAKLGDQLQAQGLPQPAGSEENGSSSDVSKRASRRGPRPLPTFLPGLEPLPLRRTWRPRSCAAGSSRWPPCCLWAGQTPSPTAPEQRQAGRERLASSGGRVAACFPPDGDQTHPQGRVADRKAG